MRCWVQRLTLIALPRLGPRELERAHRQLRSSRSNRNLRILRASSLCLGNVRTWSAPGIGFVESLELENTFLEKAGLLERQLELRRTKRGGTRAESYKGILTCCWRWQAGRCRNRGTAKRVVY